jgi:hypothetical protein
MGSGALAGTTADLFKNVRAGIQPIWRPMALDLRAEIRSL